MWLVAVGRLRQRAHADARRGRCDRRRREPGKVCCHCCGWLDADDSRHDAATSIPLALLFHRMVRGRRYAAWLVLVLVSGYVVTWAGGGLLLQFANAALQSGVARIVSPVAPPWLVAAVILTIAGLYQFTSLKYACLDKCRSPLMFLTTRWHGGNESLQAFRIGVEHGVFCVGCCWSLMLLMFLVGTSSLVWMLLLGVVMALEKNFSWGRRVSAPLGAVLLLAAAAVVVRGVR